MLHNIAQLCSKSCLAVLSVHVQGEDDCASDVTLTVVSSAGIL